MVLLPNNFPFTPSTSLHTDLFDLVVEYGRSEILMRMQVHGDIFTTGKIPGTLHVLQKLCPRVLATKCFNEGDLPFIREVKNTEIGHLFEHLILEYLCQVKERNGVAGAIHRGETWWNWRHEKQGLFHIEIQAGWVDRSYFVSALSEATYVISEVLARREG